MMDKPVFVADNDIGDTTHDPKENPPPNQNKAGYTDLLKLNFTAKTLNDLKDIIWPYHYDDLKTHQYDTRFSDDQRPVKYFLRMHRHVHLNATPNDKFTYIGPDKKTYGGTIEHTWSDDGTYITKSKMLFGETPVFLAYGIDYSGRNANITGIEYVDLGPNYGDPIAFWVGTFVDNGQAIPTTPDPYSGSSPVGSKVFTIYYNPLPPHDTKYWGPPAFIDKGAVAAKDKRTYKDYPILNIITINYRARTVNNIHAKTDDDLPYPVDKGKWNDGDYFNENDQVSFEDVDYFCILDNWNKQPDENPLYWTTEEVGERSVDRMAMIQSGLSYYLNNPFETHTAYIIEELDLAFLGQQYPDDDYRLKLLPKFDPTDPSYDPDAELPINPWALNIEGRWMRLIDTFMEITPADDPPELREGETVNVTGYRDLWMEIFDGNSEDWPGGNDEEQDDSGDWPEP